MLSERPAEGGIERYLLTNELGDTLYAYWKIVYEELTEEFLYKDYDIKNVKLALKGRSSKDISAKSNGVSESESVTSKMRNTKKGIIGGTRQPRARLAASSKNLPWAGLSHAQPPPASTPTRAQHGQQPSFDEMDLTSTALRRVTRRLSRNRVVPPTSDDTARTRPSGGKETRRFFVPVAICVKTKHQATEQAERVLEALIGRLHYNSGGYISDIHNRIYSFAEFAFHILQLTQLTSPPPLTQLSISLQDTEISYYEPGVGELPCDTDTLVAQLFTILDSDAVITLWTALILDVRIVVYTSDANLFFFLAKPLTQLMFPFSWAFLKGITPSIELLSTPTPYFFGTLRPCEIC